MLGSVFSTPRDEPNHLLPALCGTAVVLLLLPVFLVLGWNIAGWGLAAVLWLGLHGIDFLLARLRNDKDGGVANSGMQAFGLLFKTLALLVVLFAALSKSQDVALTAGLTYGLAYTFELGLSLSTYFGSSAR
ncbi:MAG TPA: hypothetical protein VGH79_04900 [Gaiellaceae bacterium]|jgi:hypothetical protein